MSGSHLTSDDRSSFGRLTHTVAALAGLGLSSLAGCFSGDREKMTAPGNDPSITRAIEGPGGEIRSDLIDKERASRRLILIGGGEPPVEALSRFVNWAGREESHILVIPWATAYPERSFRFIKAALEEFAPASIEVAPTRDEMRDPQHRAAFKNQLETATGVYFSGGDQTEVMKVVALDTELLGLLQSRFNKGVVFAGTSAGTAIMSKTMITGNGDFSVIDASKVETAAGLGMLDAVVLDQHFIKRYRLNRLLSVMTASKEALGVGVDEDTALSVIDNKTAEVVGPGDVVIVDNQERPGRLTLDVLKPGDRFDLQTRQRLGSSKGPLVPEWRPGKRPEPRQQPDASHPAP